jgi:hypothetical protein
MVGAVFTRVRRHIPLLLLSSCASSVTPLDAGAGEDRSPSYDIGVADVASDRGAARPDSGVSPTDCRRDGTCAEVVVAGDPLRTDDAGAPLPARGYADPSLRQDPATGRLWLAYSHVHWGDAVVHVDSHLAHSDDEGQRWTFDGPLWTHAPARNPRTGVMGFTNHETVSLAPRVTPSGTRWVSARMWHIITPGPGGLDARTFAIRVAEAETPVALARAEEAVLTGTYFDRRLGSAVDLTRDVATANGRSLDEVQGCTFFDAGIIVEGARVFMVVQCARFTATGADTAREFLAVFATTPEGPVTGWRWTYLGPLTTHADALALGGENLLQSDLSRTRDGSLMILLTPSRPARPLALHDGCRGLAVASLDPPRLARDERGAPRVIADVRATDTGTGSCGHDPASRTGILVARRQDGPGMLVTDIAASGVRP